jgi:hypothetical protein
MMCELTCALHGLFIFSQWYFKPSPSEPNAYFIEQANTGLILTYPKRPIPGSQLTVEETSDSLWEVRKGHGHWV